jgi:ketosteroid isomerase-like protein
MIVAKRKDTTMKRTVVLGVVIALALAGCGNSSKQSAADQQLQQHADYYAIDQIEKTWHRAASTKNVDLMMTLWAPDATFNIATETLNGKAQIRQFFATKAAPFQPENDWVSDTPAYKIRITSSGDKGTIYFECDYIDVKTQKVASVAGADQTVQKINGKWLITSSAGASPTLGG